MSVRSCRSVLVSISMLWVEGWVSEVMQRVPEPLDLVALIRHL
jgi:hypothetical protein